MIAEEKPRCVRCGAPGPDSSGRCFDCVQADFRRIEMEMNDKRSMWKLRDIAVHAARADKGSC